jgi:hypothetical protein
MRVFYHKGKKYKGRKSLPFSACGSEFSGKISTVVYEVLIIGAGHAGRSQDCDSGNARYNGDQSQSLSDIRMSNLKGAKLWD